MSNVIKPSESRNRSITTLEVMELTEPSKCIADMEHESCLKPTTRMPRTHAQIMSDMGFETPTPVPKRFKSAWDHLVHNFPCPPEIQHRVWAARIRRMFADDCGFPVDWRCDCNKCVAGISNELNMYVDAFNTTSFKQYSDMDIESMEKMGTPVDTLSIRRVCMGVDKDIPRTYLNGEEALEGGDNVVIRFVHLFLNDEQLETTDEPGTPFTTAVGVLNGQRSRHRPRVMWIRARRLVPTHLSFN